MSGFSEDLNLAFEELSSRLVKQALELKKQIKYPALQHKLTSQEMWGRVNPETGRTWGEDYVVMREDPQMMQVTLDGMGLKDALEFSRQMEKAMEEFNGLAR